METHCCLIEVQLRTLLLGYEDCWGGVELVTCLIQQHSAKLIFATWEICHCSTGKEFVVNNYPITKGFGCLGKSEGWCRDAAHFLNYSQLVFPFSYLGIPMGSNPKSWSVWQPIISKFDAKLAKWKQRYLSIDGRITLINFVLTALPIYLLSFFRIPKKVVHKIVSIQRNFLWRGGNEASWNIFDEIFYVMIFMHTQYFQLGSPATIMLPYSFMQGSNGCVLV